MTPSSNIASNAADLQSTAAPTTTPSTTTRPLGMPHTDIYLNRMALIAMQAAQLHEEIKALMGNYAADLQGTNCE